MMFDWLGNAIGEALSSVWETVSSTIWDKFIGWIYEALFNALADFFTVMANMGANMFDLAWVQAVVKLFGMFGWSMYVVGLVVAVFDTAIEYQSSGRLNPKSQILPMIYGFIAAGAFTTVPVELYKLCITLQNRFGHDLAALFGDSGGVDFADAAIAAMNMLTGTSVLMNLFMLIALGYCVIKIFFANIKRGGMLLTLIAVGSLYIFSIPKGYMDGLVSWCKQVIALCLTAFLQMTLLFLGLLTWQSDILLGIGIMLAANEVPRIANHYGLDTSVSVNNTVQQVQTAFNVTRAIIRH